MRKLTFLTLLLLAGHVSAQIRRDTGYTANTTPPSTNTIPPTINAPGGSSAPGGTFRPRGPSSRGIGNEGAVQGWRPVQPLGNTVGTYRPPTNNAPNTTGAPTGSTVNRGNSSGGYGGYSNVAPATTAGTQGTQGNRFTGSRGPTGASFGPQGAGQAGPTGNFRSGVPIGQSAGSGQMINNPTIPRNGSSTTSASNFAPTQDRASTSGYGPDAAGSIDNRPKQNAAPQPPQKLIPTRQRTFSIPFQVASRDPQTVVELHVSADRGRNWRLYKRQRPEIGRFQFTTKRDGEYWFASRTVRGNAINTRQPIQPQLRMLVDSHRPQLSIDAKVKRDGTVAVQWHAIDQNLEAGTLKIEYQTHPNTAWKTIPKAPSNQVSPTQLRGNASWKPTEQNVNTILIRVEIRDIAGNLAAATHRTVMPQNPISSTAATLENRSTAGAIAWQPGSTGRDRTNERNLPASPKSDTQFASGDKYSSVTGKQAPAVQDQVEDASHPTGRTNSISPATRSNEQAKTLWTNSEKFMLEYNVDASSQVASVELWGTRDGKTWLKWGHDKDRRSPMPVKVDRAGVYGFRIVVVGDNGLASDRPRTGDPADIWIGIDKNKPFARITSVESGSGRHSGGVVIRWEAQDDAIASAPIQIDQRTDPTAPWATIARDIANSGEYVWRPANVPPRVEIRLTVKDQAGNATQVEAKDVVLKQTPSGRISGFRPAGE